MFAQWGIQGLTHVFHDRDNEYRTGSDPRRTQFANNRLIRSLMVQQGLCLGEQNSSILDEERHVGVPPWVKETFEERNNV
jgi:hypothetical protein